MQKKAMLIIMDGWGKGQRPEADAIYNAKTPFVDALYSTYPNAELITFGQQVGLPEGQMGNSEVGHLNLGAGRIVYQELERINQAIASGEFQRNEHLLNCIQYAKDHQCPLHLLGLVSDGGVHSHIQHIKAIIDVCRDHDFDNVFIHAFTDGRDTDPESGLGYIADLEDYLNKSVGKIASITGRYYAMDRDKRWDRVKKAYDNLVHGNGVCFQSAQAAIQASYDKGVTDEFIEPITICNQEGQALATIQNGDAVLCFNFRTDRCREITEVLSQYDMPEYDMKKLNLHYATKTEYNKAYEGISILFANDDLRNTMGEILAQHGKKQLRIAETEKYPHVTFFFSGGREALFQGEDRILKPSPKDVPTYDLKPEMSAHELTEALLPELNKSTYDFICLNYANADMVGHTGVWEAAMRAAETVDACIAQIVPKALANGYAIFLTADHGNSDCLKNEDGSPNTAHTKNPVPLFFISNEDNRHIKSGKLGDVAPTILSYMQLPIPKEMTGDILLY